MPIDRIFQIFNELHIPCFILFDYDPNNSNKDIVDKSKEILEFIGNDNTFDGSFFIDEKVAYFPENWEKTIHSDNEEIQELKQKAKSKKQKES